MYDAAGDAGPGRSTLRVDEPSSAVSKSSIDNSVKCSCCGYELMRSRLLKCPECSTSFTIRSERDRWQAARIVLWLSVCFFFGGFFVFQALHELTRPAGQIPSPGVPIFSALACLAAGLGLRYWSLRTRLRTRTERAVVSTVVAVAALCIAAEIIFAVLEIFSALAM